MANARGQHDHVSVGNNKARQGRVCCNQVSAGLSISVAVFGRSEFVAIAHANGRFKAWTFSLGSTLQSWESACRCGLAGDVNVV